MPTTEHTSQNRRLLSVVDLMLVALPPFVIAIHSLANNDLPMHIAIGEWILAHGALPSQDPFSYTAGGAPWVPHEWLAGVLFALLERSSGVVGLTLFAGFAAAGLALAHRSTTALLGVDTARHLAWCIPLWLMAGRRLTLRPHLLALALPFLLWSLLLWSRRRPGALWLVPAVMAVWVNLHGSFLLGFGIIGLELMLCGRGHPVPWRRRLIVTALSGAALLTQVHVYFQPDLLSGIQHALGLMSDPVFMGSVSEWRPPFATPAFRQTYAFWISVAWIGAFAYGMLRSGSRVPLAYRLFALVTLALYFRHQRFIALFALASLPCMPVFAKLAHASAWPWGVRWAAAISALLFIYPGFPLNPDRAPRRPAFRWGYEHPFEAVEELKRRGYRGGVFCEYPYGGAVAWKGGGEIRPTMDSRNTVYGADAFVAHERAMHRDTPYRRELLDEVGAALIRRSQVGRNRDDIIEHLRRDPRWERVAEGRRWLLYMKTAGSTGLVAPHPGVVEALEADLPVVLFQPAQHIRRGLEMGRQQPDVLGPRAREE